MAVNSIGSASTQALQALMQQHAVSKTGDSDGDRDGSPAARAQAPSAPTTNSQGQTVGTIINTTA